MSGAASRGGLDPAGWKCDENGEIKNGEPQCKDEKHYALFKHSQSLEAEDVSRMKVVAGGGAQVGIAAEGFDVERHWETQKSTAVVFLECGSTEIRSDISEDGKEHVHHDLFKDRIPKTLPYDLALRINKAGNMPQRRFNEDGQWHDIAPEGGAGLKAGPWFPFLMLYPDDRLSDHRVNRPRPVKGAGMKKSLAPSAVPASDGAGAAAVDVDESAPLPQEDHIHEDLLKDYIPKTLPFDLALRINKDGNMPQLRFNEDGQWHDFVPEGGTGLKAGPWFPYLLLYPGNRLCDHRVNRPRPVKGAGMKKSLAPSASPASDGAGAAAVDVDEA
jgi:hypothetical protein